MSFSDDIKKFNETAKKAMEAKEREVQENAKKALIDVLGDDASLIEGISLDADTGKFHSVVAPERVLAKLHEANLLKA